MRGMKITTFILATAIATASLCAAEPIVLADFEGDTYGAWTAEGSAFGKGPARGTLPRQMHVDGFQGKGLVNSFNGGDGATGKLTSPTFKLERKFINFLIGGGGWEKETFMALIIDGKTVRTATGPNTEPGGTEALDAGSWDVAEFAGRDAKIVIVDERKSGWGHLNVDSIVQSDTPSAAKVVLEKTLTVNGSHLIVPVSNFGKGANSFLLGIYDGEKLVQSFTVALPEDGAPFWKAAYSLETFGFSGKKIRIAMADGKRAPESCRAAFESIKVGAESEAQGADDYTKPYRNQFHASTRRGWNNDPNGMVFHGGKFHLYYQYNPFGIQWGNMHWGHLESTDLVHWEEKPVALFQKTVKDMAFSGGGFVDFNNSAGLGKDTLFVAFTSTGRGECLAYSKDGGLTFTELPENPVVKHIGRDPKIIWHKPEQKWVMAVYDETTCAETDAVPAANPNDKGHAARNIAFWESRNLRQWTRTGAFTDKDRDAVFECPEIFELPVAGKPGETRWILLGAQDRYFIGKFDGKTFHKESGPHGSAHGIFYAAQTFSDVPDGRRIQIGWVRTDTFLKEFPDQVSNQSFTLPHEMTLRETTDGLRVFFTPVNECEKLRGEVIAEGKDVTLAQANELLQKANGELSETLIEFADGAPRKLVVNGMDAGFHGQSARIFSDRTFNEIYADGGISYEVRKRPSNGMESKETKLSGADGTTVRSLKIFRLKSIWKPN
jgi:fructan beta-fructosidase